MLSSPIMTPENNVNGNEYIDAGDLWDLYPDLNNPQKVTVTSNQITPNIDFSIIELTGGKLQIKLHGKRNE